MPRSIWQLQWHLEKHSLSSSRCQPSSRQRQQLLWLASQTSTWSQEWHPKSSTPRPSPQLNHQSTSQGTKAQPYENEKLASPSSYLDSPTCPTYCTNRWSQPNHHSMMLPRMTYHEDVVSYKARNECVCMFNYYFSHLLISTISINFFFSI